MLSPIASCISLYHLLLCILSMNAIEHVPAADPPETNSSLLESFFTGQHLDLLLYEVSKYLPCSEGGLQLRATSKLFNSLVKARVLTGAEEEAILEHMSRKQDNVKEGVRRLLPSGYLYYRLNFIDEKDQGVLYWAVYHYGSLDLVIWLHHLGASLKNPRAMRRVLESTMYYSHGIQIFTYLIDHGCVLGYPGEWNILSTITMMNEAEYFIALLERNLVRPCINVRDVMGRSPIFYARKRAVAESLIEAGADVRMRDGLGLTARTKLEGELWQSRDSTLIALLKAAETNQ